MKMKLTRMAEYALEPKRESNLQKKHEGGGVRMFYFWFTWQFEASKSIIANEISAYFLVECIEKRLILLVIEVEKG